MISDAYLDEYNDTIEDIQATEIMYNGSFESYNNISDHSFGVVKTNNTTLHTELLSTQ